MELLIFEKQIGELFTKVTIFINYGVTKVYMELLVFFIRVDFCGLRIPVKNN